MSSSAALVLFVYFLIVSSPATAHPRRPTLIDLKHSYSRTNLYHEVTYRNPPLWIPHQPFPPNRNPMAYQYSFSFWADPSVGKMYFFRLTAIEEGPPPVRKTVYFTAFNQHTDSGFPRISYIANGTGIYILYDGDKRFHKYSDWQDVRVGGLGSVG